MDILFTVILICIPAVSLSWVLPQKFHLVPLSVGTIVFLSIYSPWSLLPLLTTTAMSYSCLTFIGNRKTAMLLSSGQAVFAIVLYKTMIQEDFLEVNLTIIGLSYYSFRQIHFAVEHYKGLLPQFTFSQYFNYLFFLPTLIVGPINTFPEFVKDSNRRRWNAPLFSLGLERILYGLVKISFLGNYLLNKKLQYYIEYLANTDQASVSTYLDAIGFTMNAYIQFSGYSDIAIGISALIGYRIVENFDYPFLTLNIAEFWTKWHISLSTWCRLYIFDPVLARSRNILLAVLTSMIVLGLWHEVSFKYLVWALIQGISLFVWNQYKKSDFHKRINQYKVNKVLSWVINFHFIVFSFYLLKANSISEYIDLLNQLIP